MSDLECTVCAPGAASPHGVPATPGQAGELPEPAAGVDPASAAYLIEAHAFNAVTRALAPDMFVPLSERQAIAQAVVAAVEPVIRADARDLAAQEPHAAPRWPDGTVVRDADGEDAAEPQPAPELAASMRETRILRERVTTLACALEASARQTAPSKKSDIEDAAAGRLRKLLEQP